MMETSRAMRFGSRASSRKSGFMRNKSSLFDDQGGNQNSFCPAALLILPATTRGFSRSPMEWYYAEAGQRMGPVSNEQFDELLRTGKVAPNTLVWKEGMAQWQPYGALQGGTALAVPPVMAGLSAACVECGRTLPTS